MLVDCLPSYQSFLEQEFVLDRHGEWMVTALEVDGTLETKRVIWEDDMMQVSSSPNYKKKNPVGKLICRNLFQLKQYFYSIFF